ncbi:MAG: hypothetical protein P0Y59_17910 [Candidatus Sphingomonas phytovorans]|nr:hypothetical protein [Sphingomonas sp.]WEJ98798.1 MAG: hypothetical protein P0Y59_17910 [Sphingomonas sp.]
MTVHDNHHIPDAAPAPRRPWTTPRLETLGSMNDTMLDATQPPNDGSASPSLHAS